MNALVVVVVVVVTWWTKGGLLWLGWHNHYN